MYTWGWKECVPSVKIIRDSATEGSYDKDNIGKIIASQIEQGILCKYWSTTYIWMGTLWTG